MYMYTRHEYIDLIIYIFIKFSGMHTIIDVIRKTTETNYICGNNFMCH